MANQEGIKRKDFLFRVLPRRTQSHDYRIKFISRIHLPKCHKKFLSRGVAKYTEAVLYYCQTTRSFHCLGTVSFKEINRLAGLPLMTTKLGIINVFIRFKKSLLNFKELNFLETLLKN